MYKHLWAIWKNLRRARSSRLISHSRKFSPSLQTLLAWARSANDPKSQTKSANTPKSGIKSWGSFILHYVSYHIVYMVYHIDHMIWTISYGQYGSFGLHTILGILILIWYGSFIFVIKTYLLSFNALNSYKKPYYHLHIFSIFKNDRMPHWVNKMNNCVLFKST